MIGCGPQSVFSPPKISSLITVKYSSHYKNGVLRHPYFWRVKDEFASLDPASAISPTYFWRTNWYHRKRILVLFYQQSLLDQTMNANWNEWHNRREFFDYLGKELGYQKLPQFYGVSVETIRKYGGTALIENLFDGSLLEAFKEVFPSHNWLAFKLSKEAKWDNKDIQRSFMDNLGKELKLQHMENWYNISSKEIKENGGRILLSKYGGSPSKLLASVYSEYQWNDSNFIEQLN
jgi:hypothetical protein